MVERGQQGESADDTWLPNMTWLLLHIVMNGGRHILPRWGGMGSKPSQLCSTTITTMYPHHCIHCDLRRLLEEHLDQALKCCSSSLGQVLLKSSSTAWIQVPQVFQVLGPPSAQVLQLKCPSAPPEMPPTRLVFATAATCAVGAVLLQCD